VRQLLILISFEDILGAAAEEGISRKLNHYDRYRTEKRRDYSFKENGVVAKRYQRDTMMRLHRQN
jgi:hypothetical protein